MKIQARHESILHSSASVLILGLSSDGMVLDPVIKRLMGLYPCFYQHYKEQSQKQALLFGDIIAHPVQKQSTGLSAGTNTGASHIIGVIVQNHPTQDTRPTAWQNALNTIDSKLYELMRYNGVRHIALLAPKDNEPSIQNNAERFWQILQKLSTTRVRLDVHFDKRVHIDGFIQQTNEPIITEL